MQLDILFTRMELEERDLKHSAVVIADVLRATTVMIEALTNGAKSIIPQESETSARGMHAVLMEQGVPVLLCGEKDGFKLPDFDLGNSPLEFLPETVDSRTIIHMTTNGTKALVAASKAQRCFIASFSNIDAVAEKIRCLDASIETAYFVVSGREGRFCMEDMVCLGGVIHQLEDAGEGAYQLADSAAAARDLFMAYRERLLEMLQNCFHGKYLIDAGLGGDLPKCAELNSSALAPEMKDGRIAIL